MDRQSSEEPGQAGTVAGTDLALAGTLERNADPSAWQRKRWCADGNALGDRSAMDPKIKELYQVNGIAHILAISGLHLSFLGTGFYQFLRKRAVPIHLVAQAGFWHFHYTCFS